MTISFSGLVSGLDTSSWVDAYLSVKQQKVTTLQKEVAGYNTVKATLTDTRSTVSTLRGALEKLTDAKFGGVFDLFSQNMVKSSNEEIFTAVADSTARKQNYDVSVQQLATYTKAVSREPASSVADETTSLKNLGVKAGTFTAYVNGHKNTITINEDYTLGDLKQALEGFGVNTEVGADGVLKFSAANSGDSIHIGATTDTSNLTSLVGLERQEDGTYQSTSSVYKASIASVLTADNAGFNQVIKAGTFTIGDAEFTITENTTLSSLISEINNREDASAYAYWDDAAGKLSITSTREGASYINIEAGTSNFTDVMGFTTSEWDEDGNILASRMYTDTQTLGKNALFTVNGTQMTSTSNTVTADISRIQGVTLTLNRVNTEEDGQTSLKVSQDTDGLVDALKSFVSAYNNFVDKIDTVTANGADLHGESSLTSLKNTVRSYALSSNDSNGGVFKLLSEIGISTSSADAGNLNTDTNSLTFDEDKFLKAIQEDPDSVRALLSGDNSIFGMMEDAVEQSLKATVGFFDVKTSTLDKNIKNVNDKVTKQNKYISSYKTQLEKKFSAMENMIASMQQNYSSFLNYGATSSS